MKPLKIAIAGPKAGGKTTLLSNITKQLEKKMDLANTKINPKTGPVRIVGFADPIYMCQAAMFTDADLIHKTAAMTYNEQVKTSGNDDVVDPVLGLSHRRFRELLGSDLIRKYGGNKALVKIMDRKLAEYCDTPRPSVFVVSDVRRLSETDWCEKNGFELVYVDVTDRLVFGESDTEYELKDVKQRIETVATTTEQSDALAEYFAQMIFEHIETRHSISGLKLIN